MNKDKFLHYCKWQGLAMLNFVIVYGSCNYYASLQSKHYKMYFNWELEIPHISWMMIFYRSLDFLLIGVLFWLNKENMKKYAQSMMMTLYLAVPIFIFFPAKLGFTRLHEFDNFELAYRILYSIDLPFNLLPSMHVTYAALGIWAIIFEHKLKGHRLWFMWLWLSLICASIVFVHQHHLLDIPAGLALAAIGFWYFFKREAFSEN